MRYDLPDHRWQKSSYSSGDTGACVEIQRTDDGLLAVGDSKQRACGAFVFRLEAWSSFLEAVKGDRDPR
ncbi:DUF397 domain-containing protein [Streptomyces marincola]|uniref:DUF397 domain-containing protein n=1 Tax=Streptomyces marincola TaxID=2878388 RepID=A0A1W7CWI3_9ACTN|nr:DUF397 domain-containing protein [Streptomyces marincola]ARQ69161.1 DUF397 domain-containing protein [Streptomyces marincola]